MTTLSIWTVYADPTDYPGKFVARRFEVDANGARATDEALTGPDIIEIREVMRLMGLTFMPRETGDDPKIVECWV